MRLTYVKQSKQAVPCQCVHMSGIKAMPWDLNRKTLGPITKPTLIS